MSDEPSIPEAVGNVATALSELVGAYSRALTPLMKSVSEALSRLGQPPYQREAATLARDMAREGYDIVGRNGVEVVNTKDRVATAYYCGEEASTHLDPAAETITSYSLEELREEARR
ncbi:hypothetical protein [Halomarina litorea]|uniref:hypothetical protein n=1 Tax=Halomarina litorea TaxID=2961595 RepID=UPI0020C2A065|nr:hypothetical protein [Halomarina sp. BCD28]